MQSTHFSYRRLCSDNHPSLSAIIIGWLFILLPLFYSLLSFLFLLSFFAILSLFLFYSFLKIFAQKSIFKTFSSLQASDKIQMNDFFLLKDECIRKGLTSQKIFRWGPVFLIKEQLAKCEFRKRINFSIQDRIDYAGSSQSHAGSYHFYQ